MARPTKKGLDYFPFDVDFATNAKVEALMGEFGAKGVLFMVYLLSAVYRNGYFLQWDKLQQMQLANRVDGVSPEMADQIVSRLVGYGTFDKELFDSVRVLTSHRIQDTYLDATKRRKQQKPTLHWINVDNNSHSSEVNVDINPQSKVKESKVNKSNKEKSSGDDGSLQDNFEKLWKLYPKKAGKKPAFNAYKRAIKKGVTNKQIQTGIVELIKHQKDKKYYPNGSTWFNQARWEDDYSDSSPEPPVLNKPVPRWMRIHQVVEACGHDKAQALVELRKEYADMTAEEIDRILNPEKYEEAENF